MAQLIKGERASEAVSVKTVWRCLALIAGGFSILWPIGSSLGQPKVVLPLKVFLGDSCVSPPPQIQLFRRAGVAIGFYEINAITLAEIPQFMGRIGPIDEDGIRRDALLSWSIRWGRKQTSRHATTDRTIGFQSSVVLTLPRWCPEQAPTAEERIEWSRYLLHVLEHEAGHAGIFFRHASQFGSAVSKFSEECPVCSSREENERRFNLLHLLNSEQRQYDHDTLHGATQGARLTVGSHMAKRAIIRADISSPNAAKHSLLTAATCGENARARNRDSSVVTSSGRDGSWERYESG